MVAEFRPKGDFVTVRSRNGAVPTVRLSELIFEPCEDSVLYEEFLEDVLPQLPNKGITYTGEYFNVWKKGFEYCALKASKTPKPT